MMLPKPFSRGCYYATEAFYIPADADETRLEEYRRTIENRLNQLTWEADKAMGIKHIEKEPLPANATLPPLRNQKRLKDVYPDLQYPNQHTLSLVIKRYIKNARSAAKKTSNVSTNASAVPCSNARKDVLSGFTGHRSVNLSPCCR